MSEIDLCDIYRVRNPNSTTTACNSVLYGEGNLLFNKEDLTFLVSDCLQDSTESVEIIPSVGTDHSCLFMKL